MMKSLKKIVFCLACLVVMTIVCDPSAVYADNVGPNTGEGRNAYVAVMDKNGAFKYLYKDVDEAIDKYDDCESNSIESFYYSDISNTLFVSDEAYSNGLIIGEMGDDFKINIAGNATIGEIVAFGNGYSASITVGGWGSLYVGGITQYGNISNSRFVVESGVDVEIVGKPAALGQPSFELIGTTDGSTAIDAVCNCDITKKKVATYKNVEYYLDGKLTIVSEMKKNGKTYYAKTIYDEVSGNAISNDVYTLSGKNLKLYESMPVTDQASFNRLLEEYEPVLVNGYIYSCTNDSPIVLSGPADQTKIPQKGEYFRFMDCEYKVTKAPTAKKAGTVSLYSSCLSLSDFLVIPEYIIHNGYRYKVTAISANAFANNDQLVFTAIPSSVKTIGKKAFYKCSKLNSIIFANPDASALTIKSKALYGLSKNCKVVVSADKTDAYTKLLRSKGLNKKIKIMNKSEYLK